MNAQTNPLIKVNELNWRDRGREGGREGTYGEREGGRETLADRSREGGWTGNNREKRSLP